MTFVSCIYDIGFRPAQYYIDCLFRCINNNPDIKFVLFTDVEAKFVAPKNLEIINKQINELGKFQAVEDARKFLTADQNNNRIGLKQYLNINHSRVDLINEVEDDYVFWIDAALFSPNLFLAKHIDKKIDMDKMTDADFTFISKKHEHGYLHGLSVEDLVTKNLLKEDYNLVIGGFLGGKMEFVRVLKKEYDFFFDAYSLNQMLSVDECILSSINCTYFNNIVREVHFDQWYNEETRLYPQDTESPMIIGKSTFSDVFYKNFQM